jgi:chemotaxis protein CheD
MNRALVAERPHRDAGVEPLRRVVGIAEMLVSADSREQLITYALGSCLGVCVFDPVARVAGLLHLMLPNASLAPDKAAQNPLMFADTGVPQLFLSSYALGAKKERMLVAVAGGASFGREQDLGSSIGPRNVAMLRKVLWKNGVLLRKHELGGSEPRNMSIDVRSGEVTLGFAGETRVLLEGSAA